MKTNCAAQAGAVKPHLGVEWILFWPSKRKKKKKKKGPPVHHVWPCAKSQAREGAFWGAKGEKGGN